MRGHKAKDDYVYNAISYMGSFLGQDSNQETPTIICKAEAW